MELEYNEVCRQEYGNGVVLSAGHVLGHPWDTMYLSAAGGVDGDVTILLRPDEMSALAWCINGTLWSWLASGVKQDQPLRLAHENGTAAQAGRGEAIAG